MYGSLETHNHLLNNAGAAPAATRGSSASSSSSSSSDDDDFVPTTTTEHAKRILVIGSSFAATFYCIFSLNLVATAFVGRTFGAPYLSGFGLACCFVNLCGMSTITGLVMGLDTLLPQMVGVSKRHKGIAITVQRATAFVMLWACGISVIFVTAPLWFHHVFAADDERVAHLAATIVRLSAATLPVYVLEEIVQSYLGALSKALEIFFGALVGAFANPLLLYFFVARDWIGFEGAALAWTLSELCMVGATVLVAKRRGSFSKTWRGIDCDQAWREWQPFLRYAFPAMGMMLCEWSSFELMGFVAAHILPADQFSAQVILQQTATILFPTVLGVSIAVNVLVGNDVGARRTECAKKTAWVGLAMCFVEFAVTAVVIFTLRRNIAHIFTSDERISDHVVRTFPLEYLSHCCDSLFCLCGSVLRAHGHQRTGVVISFVGYFLVGLPLGWILAEKVMHVDDKILGLWIGPCIGQFLAFVIGGVFVVRMNWEQTEEMASETRGGDSVARVVE